MNLKDLDCVSLDENMIKTNLKDISTRFTQTMNALSERFRPILFAYNEISQKLETYLNKKDYSAKYKNLKTQLETRELELDYQKEYYSRMNEILSRYAYEKEAQCKHYLSKYQNVYGYVKNENNKVQERTNECLEKLDNILELKEHYITDDVMIEIINNQDRINERISKLHTSILQEKRDESGQTISKLFRKIRQYMDKLNIEELTNFIETVKGKKEAENGFKIEFDSIFNRINESASILNDFTGEWRITIKQASNSLIQKSMQDKIELLEDELRESKKIVLIAKKIQYDNVKEVGDGYLKKKVDEFVELILNENRFLFNKIKKLEKQNAEKSLSEQKTMERIEFYFKDLLSYIDPKSNDNVLTRLKTEMNLLKNKLMKNYNYGNIGKDELTFDLLNDIKFSFDKLNRTLSKSSIVKSIKSIQKIDKDAKDSIIINKQEKAEGMVLEQLKETMNQLNQLSLQNTQLFQDRDEPASYSIEKDINELRKESSTVIKQINKLKEKKNNQINELEQKLNKLSDEKKMEYINTNGDIFHSLNDIYKSLDLIKKNLDIKVEEPLRYLKNITGKVNEVKVAQIGIKDRIVELSESKNLSTMKKAILSIKDLAASLDNLNIEEIYELVMGLGNLVDV